MNNTEQIEQKENAGGNTEPPHCNKQSNQYTYWCFTLNNYTAECIEQIEQVFKHECRWYIFQEETGESGTPHLQGNICLKIKQRLTQLRIIDPRIHWESTKSVKKSILYCSKYESRTGKIYAHGIDIPEQLEIEEPRGWQLEVIDILKQKPDKRTIHWFWEPNGGVGKTTLCKYLVVKHDALMLTGKSNDMYNMISKYPNKRKVIIVDCPRSSQDYINYGAIEQIKNGLIFSGKYEGAQVVFNCPHVIVFSNQEPDIHKMSDDRWHIVEINPNLTI